MLRSDSADSSGALDSSVGTAAAFGLLGLGLMLLFIPFFTGELIEIPRAMMGAGVIFVAWLLFDAIFSEFGQ